MANLAHEDLHFILFPLMAQGHTIPMVDFSRLLAQRGATVTIITTPVNALRFQSTISRAVQSGLKIRIAELYFPSEEFGLPKGCENFDMLSTIHLSGAFYAATVMLREPFENFLRDTKPPPSCIISDMSFPWTSDVAESFHIPRLIFHGPCCFSLLSVHNILKFQVLSKVESDTERFVVPGLPDKVDLTKAKIIRLMNTSNSSQKSPQQTAAMVGFREKMMESENKAFGIVANTFQELEPEYIEEYAKAKGKKVWCIGPVSLSNKDISDKVERGDKASIDGNDCLNWLGGQDPGSVLYVCLGSIARVATSQLIEIGLGLEELNRPFIWCVRYKTEEFDKWILEEKYEERIKGRGLIIWGWAPQVLILSHRAVGGFLTHCGWNSTLEGICAGIPLLTWPLFAEQFVNEALVVQVLKVALSVGTELPIVFGEEEQVGVLVKREDLIMVAERLMDDSDEARERRERAREFGDLAKRAMDEGGSSNLNTNLLIQEIMEQANG